jgi:hypothetical protein
MQTIKEKRRRSKQISSPQARGDPIRPIMQIQLDLDSERDALLPDTFVLKSQANNKRDPIQLRS